MTPPLLLAAAPRRDPAAATGLALTAARAITSCDIADAIVHLARSDLIRAPRIAWLVDSGLGRPGWMRWRKLGARVFGRRSTLWALGPLGERGRRRWDRLRSKVNQRRRLEHLSPIGRRSCERPIDDPRRAGFFSLLALKNQTAVDKNIDRVTPVFRSRSWSSPGLKCPRINRRASLIVPVLVELAPNRRIANRDFAGKRNLKMDRDPCAHLSRKWRFGFYLPFLREAVRAIGSRGTAKKRQRYFRVVCWKNSALCLLPRHAVPSSSVNPTRRRGSARAWLVEPWGLGGDGHSQPTSRKRLHRIHPASGSPDRDSAPSC